MKIGIIILNWNGRQLLEQFLPSLIEYSKDATIYLADNASNDTSVSFVTSEFPSVKIIRNKENYGFAKGYNEVLKEVNEDVFCLLNNDVEVTKNWLRPIQRLFEQEPNTAILQPKILNYYNKTNFDYAGAAGGFIDKLGYPYCRGRIFNTLETDKGQYNDVTNIFWASGACLFVRKSVYNKLQGFDESYFAHMEEIDLCWRAKNLGHTIKYTSDSVIYHIGGATLEDSNPKKTYLNFRNSLFTLVKNAYGPIYVLIVLRLLLDGIAGLKFLVDLKFTHTVAIIKAHFSFYRNFSRLLKQRKSSQRMKNYFHQSSIVWSYFVARKRRFESL